MKPKEKISRKDTRKDTLSNLKNTYLVAALYKLVKGDDMEPADKMSWILPLAGLLLAGLALGVSVLIANQFKQ